MEDLASAFRRASGVAIAASGLFALFAASAPATTVQLGPSIGEGTSSATCLVEQECESETYVQRLGPGLTLVAPGDGVITSWSAKGSGPVKLRVFRPEGEQLIAEGTSAAVNNPTGGANAVSMPIRAGDVIGADVGPNGSLRLANLPGATWALASPAIPENGAAHSVEPGKFQVELLVNASVVLAPSLAGLVPTFGLVVGGETVKLVGNYLDGATEVKFGTVPAVFTVDSPNQITATAPAVPAGTVDVRVIGPGGTSAVTPGDQYTFVNKPPAGGGEGTGGEGTGGEGTKGGGSTPPGPGNTGGGGGPQQGTVASAAPVLSALAQSASRWRRGQKLPALSQTAAAPVGTTFSFTLSEAATVQLRFVRHVVGRRVDGSCRARNKADAAKPHCPRTVAAGTLSMPVTAGPNKLSFQGHLTHSESLEPGRYTVTLTARDAAGLKSSGDSLSFTIVS